MPAKDNYKEDAAGSPRAAPSPGPYLWERDDILAKYAERIKYEEILRLRAEHLASLERPFWDPVRSAMASLPLGGEVAEREGALSLDLGSSCLTIGRSKDLTPPEHDALARVIQGLIPWRKGPLSLFGAEIDSEWRSDYKWDRILPVLDDLNGKRVLDVGCNNGYYMFRALGRWPDVEMIVGCDPSESFFLAFETLQRFLQQPKLRYEILGIEDAPLFPGLFDVVLCLGVIYHQRNPIEALEGLKEAMTPGGQLVLESLAIPGDEPVCLVPRDRYAKLRNVYFVPTAAALAAWLARAGFVDVEIFSSAALTEAEQRTTKLAPYESLKDFLDPECPARTIEGYPAPLRAAVAARKSRR